MLYRVVVWISNFSVNLYGLLLGRNSDGTEREQYQREGEALSSNTRT